MAWDENLTEEQKRAARHQGVHARLLAGPGTGKTLTITRRILWLVEEQGVPPTEILAITFTRAAASELGEQIKKHLSRVSDVLPKVSTLHSFALRQLLRNATKTKLPQPLRIADDYEEDEIIVSELAEIMEISVIDTRRLLNELSADWQRDVADWERRFPNPNFLGTWREHREIYGYTLRSELVYQLRLSLEEQKLDLEGPPKYVVVDEYQDLNACDLAVIRALESLGIEIYCAGDDDQSIYGFRFANPVGIRMFPSVYSPCNELTLEICKRCSRRILDYGLYVAKQDPRRIEKPIKPQEGAKEGEVKVLRFPNQDNEAKGIAEICKWLIEEKGLSPEEILILLRIDRNRLFSDPIRAALITKGVPVEVVSNPLEPINTKDGRELLCWMRLVNDRDDHLAWRTILTVRDNSIGKGTFLKIYDMARREGIKFSRMLQRVKVSPELLPRTGRRVSEEIKNIEASLSELGDVGGADLDSWIQGLSERVIEDERQRKDVNALFKEVREVSGASSLQDLLRALNVSLGEAEQEKKKDCVAIMTMHQAKGLSADAVIVAAAEDEYVPGRATGEPVDDERRLLYVSLTRARNYLYVTFCQERTGQQQYSGRTPGQRQRTFTRFLSGGPHTPISGNQFVESLRTA